MVQKPLIIQAGFFRMALANVLGSFSCTFLFLLLILINALQVSSVLVWPVSKKLFRSINTNCAGFWWGTCVFFQETLYGIKPVHTGDVIPEKENAFLIVNHQAMTDISVLFGLAIRKKRLGDMKYFVKDVLKYVPGVGWGMLFLDCLFLKRNWEQDKERLKATFGKFEKENIPIWLISFVEGTRITKKKSEASQKYAKEKGLPVLNNVLLPRSKGFVAVVQNLRGHLDAIYDVTIVYKSGVPHFWQVAQGFVREFHLHVKRYPIAEIPQSDKELTEWLLKRYIEKDTSLQKTLL